MPRQTTRRSILALLFALVLLPNWAAADTFEGKVVVAVAGKLTVSDKDGDNDEFIIDAETKITLDGKPGRLDQLKPGDRVRVEADPTNKGLIARKVEARSTE